MTPTSSDAIEEGGAPSPIPRPFSSISAPSNDLPASARSSVDAIVIGAGLAGSEAAFQLAEAGMRVQLVEMRPHRQTEVHQTGDCAELVCSNSFRSDDPAQAIGLLHEELRRCNSLILASGDAHKVPAGSALAVDREGFASAVTTALHAHPNVAVVHAHVDDPVEYAASLGDDIPVVMATGPLTSAPLAAWLKQHTQEDLAFYDAIAPIVHKESIDLSIAWYESRWQKGEGKDYLNCPLSEEQYKAFVHALKTGEQHGGHDWEQVPYFDGCLPIEVMASRGENTLRFGPMKPIGLFGNPSGERPYAVVQLRQDNALGTLYNIVGFQTRMKHGAQVEIFRTIPGLAQAEFARLGGIHRNSFINAPRCLRPDFSLRPLTSIYMAGQITGVEGYIESTATGLLVARAIIARLRGRDFVPPPSTTALGCLHSHLVEPTHAEGFQPMNINFGLFPPLADDAVSLITANGKKRKLGKKERRALVVDRAQQALQDWI